MRPASAHNVMIQPFGTLKRPQPGFVMLFAISGWFDHPETKGG